MGLICGYFDKRGRHETTAFHNTALSFSILASETNGEYENKIFETKFGHIFLKYKQNYPIKPLLASDASGNLLITWGFSFVPDAATRSTDGTKLLETCVSDSPHVLEANEGEFISILVEGASGDTHIINDRFGTRPLFIIEIDGCLYFSTNFAFLLSLTKLRPTIDILGWLQLFTLGHLIGTRTTFKDFRRLPPATHLCISNTGVQERRYWRFEHHVEKDLNPEVFADEAFDAISFSTARRAMLVKGGMVTLSGGMDSRLVASTTPKEANYSALTFVNSIGRSLTSDDAKVAAEVARKLGLKHQIVRIPKGEISRSAEDAVRLSGGLMVINHPVVVLQMIREMELGAGFFLGGGPGDYLTGADVNSIDYFDADKVEESIYKVCISRIGSQTANEILGKLFHRDVIQDYFSTLKDSFLDSFTRISGPTAAHRITAWCMDSQLPGWHYLTPTRNHPGVNSAMPHLGYRYVDLMLKLPAKWLYKRDFYHFMIYRCLPQLRDVIYANTGLPLTGKMERFDTVAAQPRSPRRRFPADYVPWRVRNYLRRFRKPYYPFHYLSLQQDEALFSEITEMLHSSSSLKDVLDVERCMEFMSEFRAGHNQGSYDRKARFMGSLATMCYTFKMLDL